MKAPVLNTLLIINPISGTASKAGLKDKIEKRVRNMGHKITTLLTNAPGHATKLARQAAADGYDVVLACGGDGTVNEIASGLINTSTALCILPNGSGNGLARHIDVPIDPLLALDTLKKGRVVDCDYCTVNNIPFFCTFGIGFDAAVSYRFATGHRRGLMAYLRSALDEFISFTPQSCRISIEEKDIDVNAFLIACCNASQYGNNAFIAPTASITDGVLDITIVHSGNTLSQAFVGVELLTGSIAKGGLIDTLQTKHLIITREDKGIAHIDGEPIELPSKLEIKCHRGGLKIFAPYKRSRFRPLLTPATMFVRDCVTNIRKLFPGKEQ